MARYDEGGQRLYPCCNGAGWDTKYYDHRDIVTFRIPLHVGEYDPQHWGELDPDAYDRMTYSQGAFSDCLPLPHGRHLLDTGTN